MKVNQNKVGKTENFVDINLRIEGNIADSVSCAKCFFDKRCILKKPDEVIEFEMQNFLDCFDGYHYVKIN
jgi:hypothetical protein